MLRGFCVCCRTVELFVRSAVENPQNNLECFSTALELTRHRLCQFECFFPASCNHDLALVSRTIHEYLYHGTLLDTPPASALEVTGA